MYLSTNLTRLTRLAFAVAFVVSLLASSVSIKAVATKTPPHAAANLPAFNINDGFAKLVHAVKPAVVTVSITVRSDSAANSQRFSQQPQLEEFFRRFFGEQPFETPRTQPAPPKATAAGSGFIVDPEGLVVTNHHVIENADEIEVVLEDGTRFTATLRGRDTKTDLALLAIDSDKLLPYVQFGNSDSAQVGDWVVAIGNPFGLGGTTTSGIISARGRDIQAGPLDDFIQIDAPINRGNSGGPLFNTKGEVIGVNSAIFSPNGGNVGIGFAIPSSIANHVIAQLRDQGVVRRGFLGVYLQTVNAEIAENMELKKPTGALVTQVIDNSPAQQAGLKAGDVILTYDGKAVATMRDLPKLVARTANQTEVDIEIWRDARRRTLQVTIGNNEAGIAADPFTDISEFDALGLSVRIPTAEQREQYGLTADDAGVVVSKVRPNSAAAVRGLRAGDLIQRIDQRPIATPQEMKEVLQSARAAGKKSVLLLVERNSQARFVVVPIDS